MTSGHAPTGMIADYAAGALSEGRSLLVASHLTYCPCCRDKVARLEALGGALLTEGEGVAPGPRCLQRALARIEAPTEPAAAEHRDPPGPRCLQRALARIEAPTEPAAAEHRDPPVPRPLCCRLPPDRDLRWQPLAPGLSGYWLDGFPGERVGLVRARPGVRIAPHGHAGLEGTLVLAGRMRDGARTYGPGELVFADHKVEHAPQAVGTGACLCLVVQTDLTPA